MRSQISRFIPLFRLFSNQKTAVSDLFFESGLLHLCIVQCRKRQ